MAEAPSPGVLFRAELIGFRNLMGKFAAVDERGRESQRRMLRNVLQRLRAAAQDESPESDEVDPRHPVHFANQWRVVAQQTDRGSAGILFNESPHWNLVLFKTKPHVIRARGDAQAEDIDPIFAARGKQVEFEQHYLQFTDSSGDIIFRKSVRHPGTEGNPVHERVLARERPAMQVELRRAAREVLTELGAAPRRRR